MVRLSPASHHDSPYLPLCIAGSCHTDESIQKVYADKGYFGEPIIISSFTKLFLRKTKTDKKDAVTIARFLLLNRDSISHMPSSQLTTDMRDITRERESVMKVITSMKNDILRLLQSTFPELEQIVNVLGNTMLHFLKAFPSERLITEASPEMIAQAFEKRDGRRRLLGPLHNDRRWSGYPGQATGNHKRVPAPRGRLHGLDSARS